MIQRIDPIYEEVPAEFSDVSLKFFDCEFPNKKEVGWHFHIDYELVYVNEGSGKRHIGMHLSNYTDGELVLIGSNVPHHGFTDYFTDTRKEVVVHFKPGFLGNAIEQVPIFKKIWELLTLSDHGIVFSEQVKHYIGYRLLELKNMEHFQRYLELIDILNELAISEDKQMLNANGKAFIGSLKENERVKKVFNYIEEHFKDPISLDDVAELIHMNPSSFSRFFKKTTNKTFISYLNEYRLNHAIQLLMETELDIKNIGYECGFTNLSNFFRHFKAHTQTTPYDYRRKFSKV